MEAFAGIDVAFAKRKVLPIVVCVRKKTILEPLPLHAVEGISPPRGEGNAKSLDPKTVANFADATAHYLHAVEDRFKVVIRRIAIDSPSSPKAVGAQRREARKLWMPEELATLQHRTNGNSSPSAPRQQPTWQGVVWNPSSPTQTNYGCWLVLNFSEGSVKNGSVLRCSHRQSPYLLALPPFIRANTMVSLVNCPP